MTATSHEFEFAKPPIVDDLRVKMVDKNYWTFEKPLRVKMVDENYWTFEKPPIVAESSAKMVDKNYWAFVNPPVVAESSTLKPNLGNRQALVMGSSGNESTFSKAKQQKMESDLARRVAREGLDSDSMAFLIIVWEGEKITMFTSNQYLKDKLEETGSFSHSTPFPTNNDNPVVVSRFESKGGRGKEIEFDEEGVVRVNRSNIRSYPVLMSFLNELKEDDCFFPSEMKTVLYSYKMTERSIPIK